MMAFTLRQIGKRGMRYFELNHWNRHVSSSYFYCLYSSQYSTLKPKSVNNYTTQYISNRHYGLVPKNPNKEPLTPKPEDELVKKCVVVQCETVEQKQTLFSKFKRMYKDYWYVLVPVHLVTSTVWGISFYYAAKSGVDIVGIMESVGFSEKIIGTFRDSSMGYIALAYALYKMATPARYFITLGGTTISINYLKKFGYIKPVPSREQIKVMLKERKEGLQEMYQERKDGIQGIINTKKKAIVRNQKNVWEEVIKKNQQSNSNTTK